MWFCLNMCFVAMMFDLFLFFTSMFEILVILGGAKGLIQTL